MQRGAGFTTECPSTCRMRPSAAWNSRPYTAGERDQNPLQPPRIFGLTLPHDDAAPAGFFERDLMAFVTGGVAIQFGQPPFPTIRRRRAVFAAAMPVPKAAVNKDGSQQFRQNDVGPTGKFSGVKPKAIAHPMQL